MLQSLKATDRLSELLPRIQVLDRDPNQRLHDAHRLRAQRGEPQVQCRLDRRKRVALPAQSVALGHAYTVEVDVGGPLSVDGEIFRSASLRARPGSPKRATGPGASPASPAVRADAMKHIGESCVRHHRLVTVEPKSIARGSRTRLDPRRIESRPGLEVSQSRDAIAGRHGPHELGGATLFSYCRSNSVAMTALVRIGSSNRPGPHPSISASVSVGP